MFQHLTLCLILTVVATTADRSHSNTLKSGSVLKEGEYLVSENKAYYAIIQADGNFVLYVSNHFCPENALWHLKISNKPPFVGPYRLTMQSDGNLVVYDVHNRAVWNTATTGTGKEPHRLIMQNDGNLVLYDGKDKPLWYSNTARSC